jgi:hypothetical protein
MFELLKRQDVPGFRAAAAQYGVRFVLLTRDRSREWLRPSGLLPRDLPEVEADGLKGLPAFALAFQNERFAIFAVKDAGWIAEQHAGVSNPAAGSR